MRLAVIGAGYACPAHRLTGSRVNDVHGDGQRVDVEVEARGFGDGDVLLERFDRYFILARLD